MEDLIPAAQSVEDYRAALRAAARQHRLELRAIINAYIDSGEPGKRTLPGPMWERLAAVAAGLKLDVDGDGIPLKLDGFADSVERYRAALLRVERLGAVRDQRDAMRDEIDELVRERNEAVARADEKLAAPLAKYSDLERQAAQLEIAEADVQSRIRAAPELFVAELSAPPSPTAAPTPVESPMIPDGAAHSTAVSICVHMLESGGRRRDLDGPANDLLEEAICTGIHVRGQPMSRDRLREADRADPRMELAKKVIEKLKRGAKREDFQPAANSAVDAALKFGWFATDDLPAEALKNPLADRETFPIPSHDATPAPTRPEMMSALPALI